MKDWTGNKKSTFVTLGASNHSLVDREEHDFYSTDPKSLEIFLKAYLNVIKTLYQTKYGNVHVVKVI